MGCPGEYLFRYFSMRLSVVTTRLSVEDALKFSPPKLFPFDQWLLTNARVLFSDRADGRYNPFVVLKYMSRIGEWFLPFFERGFHHVLEGLRHPCLVNITSIS
ncbi:MAG: hypothetical protein FJY85_25755 [Deltaproteobacteria bacterium]|nr:hypothetical protein [Deltaproteobacteria bacterium]